MKKQTDRLLPNALVAILKRVKDLKRVQEHSVYHIPKKSAPQLVRNKLLRYIAFYQPKVFEKHKYTWEENAYTTKMPLICSLRSALDDFRFLKRMYFAMCF